MYKEMMENLMSNTRALKKLTAEETAPVQCVLLSVEPVIKTTVSMDDFESDLSRQKLLFLNQTGFSTQQFDYYARCLSYFGDVCAKVEAPMPARIAWTKLRESGHLPIENCLSTYMYVFSLDDDIDWSFEAAEFHDAIFPLNEKTVTLRMKGLIAQDNTDAAEQLLATLPCKDQLSPTGKTSHWKRLRTFQPLLSYYCDNGRVNRVLDLFRQMKNSPGVFFESDTYAEIIACLASRGCFNPDASAIEPEDSCDTLSGPRLFDMIVSSMAEDLLELSEQSALRIVDAFSKSQGGAPLASQELDVATERLCIKRVEVDNSTAICPETGIRLKLFALTDDQRVHVHETLLEMAASQYEEFGQKLKARGRLQADRDGDYARSKLEEFAEWLGPRQLGEQAYTAFIDGPNVAYYGHGDIHYSQVKLIFDHLVRMGEKPLVIMPQKYIAKRFSLHAGRMQELTSKEMEIMTSLTQNEQMYAVPLNCLDDYYWMLASVVDMVKDEMEGGRDDRFPGLRPILVTNDQMRDHKLSLLEPREFRRWISCHVVNYYFPPYSEDEWEDRAVQLYPTDRFSREIQSNAHPQRPSENVWHFPITEWLNNERLCIHIKGLCKTSKN
jgi:pentatricopeptide repeat protein